MLTEELPLWQGPFVIMLKNTGWIKLQSEMGEPGYEYSINKWEEGEKGGLGELRAASVPAAAGLGFQDQQTVVMVTSRNSRVFRETEQVLILFSFAFPSWPILRMNSLSKLVNAFWLHYSTGTWPFCVSTYLFLPSLSLWLDYKPLKDTVWIPSPSLTIRVNLNY